ncbi:MAG: Methionine aminopeptidase, type I [uncultured bacterium]|nr:MAG: Methionine aminopeptidase, type I [uncultured bacterium]
MKIGRNDPCWCGSGNKYKKCHMQEDLQKMQNTIPKNGRIISRWIKSPEEIEGMRKAGKFNGELMDYIRAYVKPGISTSQLDKLIEQYTKDHGHVPACFKYRGYPKSSCISPNEVVCHGVPNENTVLKEGDIVNVDITTIVNGFHGDQSETFFIGEVSGEARDLTLVAGNSLIEGLTCIKEGVSFAMIGALIEEYAHSKKYSVVVDYTGHGIGKFFHEDPHIYHFKNTENLNLIMAAGMTFTVEPMINAGTWKVEVDKHDNWTVRTQDKRLSAQFEHTILVTKDGFEVLTLTEVQKKAGKICLLSNHPANKI